MMAASDRASQDSFSEPDLSDDELRSGAPAHVSDTRAGLKDFIRGKKTAEPTKSELEDYLDAPLDEASLEDEFDVLGWWKLKAAKYPILSRLTRDILAVPISTVASESAFSISGRTLSPTRSSLCDETLEALICGQDWLRSVVIEEGMDLGDTWPNDEVDDGASAGGESFVL